MPAAIGVSAGMRFATHSRWHAMHRRTLLLIVLLTTLPVGRLMAQTSDPAPDSRPNVVLIISDDHAWTDYGCMGNNVVRTPHIDRLAREGLTFTRGYVTTALCSPSLATLLTGLHPHQHGITGNDPDGDQPREAWLQPFFQHPLLPRLLADSGYRTLQTGKYWMRQPAAAGFTDSMGDTARHGGQALAIGRDTMQPVYDFVDQAQQAKQPFFVWYAPLLPHQPHDPPPRLLQNYAAVKPPAKAKYYAMIEWLDETVGELMNHLQQRGLDDNTLVIYLSDNGWNEFGKASPYENGVRTPIILRWPAQIAAARDDEHLAQNIDIFPTILTACGVPLPEAKPGPPLASLPGINLLDLQAVAARETLYFAQYAHNMVSPKKPAASLWSRSVIHGHWKLVAWVGNPPQAKPNQNGERHRNPDTNLELFNLETDPGETTNLAATHPERVTDLLNRLDHHWRPDFSSAEPKRPSPE
jgi:arylsulfatase A-like enzyme